jgi:hypothetical protein
LESGSAVFRFRVSRTAVCTADLTALAAIPPVLAPRDVVVTVVVPNGVVVRVTVVVVVVLA